MAVYLQQVLQGLEYLHIQGTIHRDVKGANILTTKEGQVKLADFGVAARTGVLRDQSVVGTPNWMAPEVVELNGATSASDIWSMGCTIIELLTGNPPYHSLDPMAALFAIVERDHPPIPEGISPELQNFLLQCFQKDPNLRVSAKKLLKHAWIQNNSKLSARNYNDAVKTVKIWNQATQSQKKEPPGKDSPHHQREKAEKQRNLLQNLLSPGGISLSSLAIGSLTDNGKHDHTL